MGFLMSHLNKRNFLLFTNYHKKVNRIFFLRGSEKKEERNKKEKKKDRKKKLPLGVHLRRIFNTL